MEKAEGSVRRLPSGPHGIPPELIKRNQRERLIAAMAEVCGERGYAATSVAEVSKRAGVSTASFYRQFKDRKECLLASFDELFGRLLAEIESACVGEQVPAARMSAAAATAAALLAADAPAARLLSIEIAAIGGDGVLAQHRAIERLAGLLRAPSAEASTDPDATWARVAALVSLIGRRSAEGVSPTPTELERILAPP